MRILAHAILSGLLVFILTAEQLSSAATLAANEGVTVNGRLIPPPAGASQQLRQAIRDFPPPVYPNSSTAPSSLAEWESMIKGADSGASTYLPALINKHKVTVLSEVINGVNVHRITPATISESNTNRVFLFVHGGAYVFGQDAAGISEAILIASRLSIVVVSIDYRMPPAHPFPAALDDVVAVYKKIIQNQTPATIIIGGTSAGAGLAMASVHQFHQLGLTLPGAVYAGTPWADLSKTGDTLYTNQGLDRVLVVYEGLLSAAASLYADGKSLKNPLLSPIYGEFDYFPPTILFTGTRDMFLSDVARTHRKLRAAGVLADLHVYEGMSHAGYLLVPDAPESVNLYKELRSFVDRHVAQ